MEFPPSPPRVPLYGRPGCLDISPFILDIPVVDRSMRRCNIDIEVSIFVTRCGCSARAHLVIGLDVQLDLLACQSTDPIKQ